MYGIINIPGSTHFQWFGPATKAECNKWVDDIWKETANRVALGPRRWYPIETQSRGNGKTEHILSLDDR